MTWTCKAVTWQREETRLREIRQRVFIEEQGVKVPEEWDGEDNNAQHFLLLNGHTAIGCARIITENSGDDLHIGRVAILAEYRGQGAGLTLMRHLIDWCTGQCPDASVYLHAQTSVTGFYQQLGFICQGEVFMDAGIPHISMRLPQRSPNEQTL